MGGMKTNWKDEYLAELRRGYRVRAEGNEGQARVCARRAAGVALREYWRRRGRERIPPSAYALLNELLQQPALPPEIRRAATYLTLRVNEAFRLPVAADLLAEAQRLADWLLPGETPHENG